MSDGHFITVEAIRKTYKVGGSMLNALDGLDMTLEKGEMCTLMGPSGSGKTTLLNMLGGLDVPDEGAVRIGKVELTRLNEGQRAAFRRGNVGFIFQFFNLIPSLTAIENVLVPVMFDRGDMSDKARELLERVGLGNRTAHLPGELSGGERQRVAIARALINDPSLILADEPTGNIDSETAREIVTLFRELNSEGKTLVLATHDRLVASRSGKNFRMRDGKIVRGGAIKRAPAGGDR